MAKKSDAQASGALFGPNFLDDHAGQIMSDQRIAIMELIANASDAGATQVKVQWPIENGNIFSVEDNGIGMTKNEFLSRWSTLSFDRRKAIGKEVIFPPEITPKPKRSLFGKSGKGRHATFCFADEYKVETWKNGKATIASVKHSNTVSAPFNVSIEKEEEKEGHGTNISAITNKNLIDENEVIELIGSKFLIDPSFSILVNGKPVLLTSISGIKTETIKINDTFSIEVVVVDTDAAERSNRLRGVAWWVNNRLVGAPSWRSINGGPDYLDGRSKAAKRYAFLIKADTLDQFVKEDWSGFKINAEVQAVNEKVDEFIKNTISGLLSESRKETKMEVLDENKTIISELPPSSRTMVGKFVEEVQQICPTMKTEDMASAVQVFAKLEQARSGYDILKQLAACKPEDLDRWNEIMKRWDARHAQIVLDEIEKRLHTIVQMKKLIHDKQTDELHELHPLFEQGLWIFGPQYESVEYMSNRSLKTLVEQFLGGNAMDLNQAQTRPDLITSPVRVWDTHAFDANGEVNGIAKVMILELKKGGFTISQKELDQARDYAIELKKANAIQVSTEVDCIVMGSKLNNFISNTELKEQKINIIPKTYEVVLRQADARLLNLRKRIEDSGVKVQKDAEIENILSSGIQQKMNFV